MKLSTQELQDLALVLTVVCVRDTIIEDYHADRKLTGREMKAFNKEVVNRLYTVLSVMFGNAFADVREPFLKTLFHTYPSNWDRPTFDEHLQKGLEDLRTNEELRQFIESNW